ncbi:MAG TPA: DUF1207 domain-containing protein [Longimicrobiaceae bacterium]|nr:DUF1207 domain-containing protein [Longimicrobiaceae bacterium]
MKTRPLVQVVLVLCCVAATAGSTAAQTGPPLCGTGLHAGEDLGPVWFPEGDLFCPLLGDPKAARSFASLLRGELPTISDADGDATIGAVGLADRLSLFRLGGPRSGDGLQLSIFGAVFAQFDLSTESFDLVNADYIIGIPLSMRRAGFSSRLTIFHQSSHLGDEYLLRSDLERENLSFESLELILSQELGSLRIYGGGEYLFNREPDTLESLLAHTGAEVRFGPAQGIRFVAAADLKSSEQQEWDPAVSARAGVELAHWRHPDHPPRLFAILAEFYDGPSPYGQFFQEQIRYFGVGLHLSLR